MTSWDNACKLISAPQCPAALESHKRSHTAGALSSLRKKTSGHICLAFVRTAGFCFSSSGDEKHRQRRRKENDDQTDARGQKASEVIAGALMVKQLQTLALSTLWPVHRRSLIWLPWYFQNNQSPGKSAGSSATEIQSRLFQFLRGKKKKNTVCICALTASLSAVAPGGVFSLVGF